MGFRLTIIIGVISFIALAILGPSIAGFVIASNSMNDTCSDQVLIRLPIWLIINGSVNIFLFVVSVFLYFQLSIVEGDYQDYVPIWMTSIYVVFQTAWTVCGAVSLFNPLNLCRTSNLQLYSVTLASLIIGWAMSAFGVIYFIYYCTVGFRYKVCY